MNLSQQQVSPNSVRTNSPSHQRPYRCWKGFNLNLTRFKVGFGIAAIVSLLSLASQAQEVIVYSTGFEADDGGFLLLETSNSAGWAWGTPSSSTVGPGAAHAGAKCWGTVLDGRIPRPCDGSIVSPPISLPSIATNEILRVRFWAYIDLDGMTDRGEFFVSTNRTTWQSLIQFYNTMEHQAGTTPTWKSYEFSLSPAYSGMPLYLRFRAVVFSTSPSFGCGGSAGAGLSGVYVDDIAITKNVKSGAAKIFTMEAQEDPSSSASCPWVAPWDGTAFVADNDIYSVARGADGEYSDSYRLQKPLVPLNGSYWLEVQERDSETSFTDNATLVAVDHAADVAVAPDGAGNLTAYRPTSLLAPVSAVSGQSQDVLSLVTADDNIGFPAYHGDTVSLDFGTVDLSRAAVLVLKVKGFIVGTGPEIPFTSPPAVVVETRDTGGNWTERGRLLPRFENSYNAFDLKPYLTAGQAAQVRLRSISHSTKYQSIDFVRLYTGAAPSFTAATLQPTAAWFGSQNVLATLASTDGNRVKISSGEKFSISFPVPALATGNVREFVFCSRGYYLPSGGSYLVYTKDANGWVQRDSFTYPGTEATKSYDLSLFLPDPNGELRVQVWQDYQYEPAGIDYVTMTVDGVTAPLNYAWDYRYNSNILSLVQSSDNNRISWSGCPRNRVTEYAFTSSSTNIPPSVVPVTTVAGAGTNTFTIHWTYYDPEGAPQAQAEIQIWTGPGATGNNVWNPPPFLGTNEFALYTGPALPAGVYYVRVRANDGTDWGPWGADGTWPPGGSSCSPTVTSASTPTVNPQTGLLEQSVVVGNPCSAPTTTPFLLLITSLPAGVQVFNATGTNNGTPFVQYDGVIPGNGTVTLIIEYYVSNRATFTPTLNLVAAAALPPLPTTGTALAVTRAQMLPGGSFLVEFNSVASHSYVINYSADLTNWVSAAPLVRASANRTQWIDAGPPKTTSPPGPGGRYYRVVEMPQP